MSILEQINSDFLQAYKAKEQDRVSTLRLLLAVTKNEKIKKMADLTDEDVIKTLKSEIKKRREAIADYEKGNRPELVAKETAEIKIIETYLPAQMSEEDVRQKIKAILATQDKEANLGKLMGVVMTELKGQADGTLVRKIVEEELK